MFIILLFALSKQQEIPQVFQNTPTLLYDEILKTKVNPEISEHALSEQTHIKHDLYVGNNTQGNPSNPDYGLQSPNNVFLEDDYGIIYSTHVHVENRGRVTTYKVCVDINLPFIFLTEQQSLNSEIHFTKMIPSATQLNTILLFIQPRFPAIIDFTDDIYFVTEGRFWVNEQLSASLQFFYLIGYGATYMKNSNNLDGYIGTGLYLEKENPSLNIVVKMFEEATLSNSTYALYFGNEFGYIDSLFFLGGFQQIFLQQQQLTEIQLLTRKTNNWCVSISQLFLITNTSLIYTSDKRMSGCISSIYPFLYLPSAIIDTIKLQIEKDGTIECNYITSVVQKKNSTLLECASKIPVYESLKYPQIMMQVLTTTGSNYNITLESKDYIQKCLYDVENYAKKCTTTLAKSDANTISDIADSDIILGLPFLRVYYSYFNLNNNSLMIAESYKFIQAPQFSQFWYYSLLAVIFCWAILMMTCGIYYKDQMTNLMKFVNNIIKYIMGDQNARLQLIASYLTEDIQQ